MPSKRPLFFDLHILPLFRITEREAMLSEFDLWDYRRVRECREEILRRIDPNHPEHNASLPPRGVGGPWPEEWIALFRRWVAEGCRNLELARADRLRFYRIDLGRYRLVARGRHPGPGYGCWLQRLNQTIHPREYVLYREPPRSYKAGGPTDYEIELVFQSCVPLKRVLVLTGQETQSIPLHELESGRG